MSAGDRDTLTDHANHREHVRDCEPCLERLNAVYAAQDQFNRGDRDGCCDWISHIVDPDCAFEYGFYAGERWAKSGKGEGEQVHDQRDGREREEHVLDEGVVRGHG